jgi:hypothetical protein
MRVPNDGRSFYESFDDFPFDSGPVCVSAMGLRETTKNAIPTFNLTILSVGRSEKVASF